jgi:hypothetical protein
MQRIKYPYDSRLAINEMSFTYRYIYINYLTSKMKRITRVGYNVLGTAISAGNVQDDYYIILKS